MEKIGQQQQQLRDQLWPSEITKLSTQGKRNKNQFKKIEKETMNSFKQNFRKCLKKGHNQQKCKYLLLSKQVNDHKVCYDCMQESEFQKDEFITIKQILTYLPSQIFSTYPPLEDKQLLLKLKNLIFGDEKEGEQQEISKIDSSFSELVSQFNSLIDKMKNDLKQERIELLKVKEKCFETYQNIANLPKLKEILISSNEQTASDLHEFIVNICKSSGSNTKKLNEQLDNYSNFKNYISKISDDFQKKIIEVIKEIEDIKFPKKQELKPSQQDVTLQKRSSERNNLSFYKRKMSISTNNIHPLSINQPSSRQSFQKDNQSFYKVPEEKSEEQLIQYAQKCKANKLESSSQMCQDTQSKHLDQSQTLFYQQQKKLRDNSVTSMNFQNYCNISEIQDKTQINDRLDDSDHHIWRRQSKQLTTQNNNSRYHTSRSINKFVEQSPIKEQYNQISRQSSFRNFIRQNSEQLNLSKDQFDPFSSRKTSIQQNQHNQVSPQQTRIAPNKLAIILHSPSISRNSNQKLSYPNKNSMELPSKNIEEQKTIIFNKIPKSPPYAFQKTKKKFENN